MAEGETPPNACPRRGRPRVRRSPQHPSAGATSQLSRCVGTGISLQPEEIELIRLIDLEGLEQEEEAEQLGSPARPRPP